MLSISLKHMLKQLESEKVHVYISQTRFFLSFLSGSVAKKNIRGQRYDICKLNT